MKSILTAVFVLSIAILGSCDVRSGIAKEEMEKFNGTPTPSISPEPTAMTIDAADIVQVDTALDGDTLTVNGYQQNKTITCTKYNRVMVNGNSSVVTIKGACRQIMVNGDGNKITSDAAVEFIVNGSENVIRYSRFPNGKRPFVTDNGDGNLIEKISAEAVTDN